MAAGAPEPGDLMVVPVSSGYSRAALRRPPVVARGKHSRKVATAHRTPAASSARRARATVYHTASLAAKHRSAAN